MVEVADVQPGSPAAKAGLTRGTKLFSIDGHEIRDGLDYEFYSSGSQLSLEVEQRGMRCAVRIEKAEYQPLGCEFATYLIDPQHSCRNKCVFCFVDQLPAGMRQSLYFKDDDERLSFLFGNYITLTNLTDREVERIIDMRISPVNISVHTTNPALRVEMMKNKRAGEVLEYIPRLAKAGVSLNTQLVLVPGMNDGPELRRSIEWLASFAPALESIAAVPVGLTCHRQGLAPIRAYTPAEAAAQLDILLEYGEALKEKHGVRIVYPSDEWFLLAGREMPGEEFYDGYPQLENGVGMWRLLEEEFTAALEGVVLEPVPRAVHVATGLLAEPLLRKLAAKAMALYPQIDITVHGIRNDFFGPGVTVAGLVTGGDIIRQLEGKLCGGTLLLPDVMLRAEGDRFLDDTTPEAIGEALGAEIEIVGADGESLLEALLWPSCEDE